ncbi:MAG: Maf family protein [Rhodospirillales bacterium]
MVLASASGARARLLERACVPFVRDISAIDEGRIKADAWAQGWRVEEAAAALAEAKAMAVAARHPGALVVGADQILEFDGVWVDKATTLEEAADVLQRLRGRDHRLVSAATVVHDGLVRWRTVDSARVTMRLFSASFLLHYLQELGPDVLESVGCYRLEGLGVQLFAAIEGSFFTILGLPLLPLLEFLRTEGIVEP